MTAIILAGGRGRRLHPAKCTLLVGGEPIVARVIAQAQAVVDRIVISASPVTPYESFGVPVVADCFSGCGPLAGMHAAMIEYPDADYLVLGGDMPFVSRRVLDRLVADWAGTDAQALVPVDAEGRRQPLQAIYAHSCLPVIEERLRRGERRVGAFLDATDTHQIDLGPLAGCSFFNVNTPASLAQARDMAARMSDASDAPREPLTLPTGYHARS